jgi:hypothetical protein
MPLIKPATFPESLGRMVKNFADIVPETIATLASTIPPPRPHLAPLDHCGIIYQTNNSVITQITDPMPTDQLTQMRTDLIENTSGAENMVVVHKSIAAKCKVGMSKAVILDFVEHVQREGYELLLGPDWQKPNPNRVNSRIVVGEARTEIEVEQNGRWIPFGQWWKGKGQSR